MKIKTLMATAALSLAAGGAYAQNPDQVFVGEGYITGQLQFGLTDLHKLSSFNRGIGTARSAAMGGAFTSLGADMSSMSINPAGLGMFRSTSEFSVTGGINVNSFTNDMRQEGRPGGSWTGKRTSGSFNNIGATLNGYEGLGSLTSLTWGVGYTQLADFNYRSTVDASPSGMYDLEDQNGNVTSFLGIGDMFAWQLKGYSPEDLQGSRPWGSGDRRGTIDYGEWGAGLGYQTGLVAQDGTDNIYYVPGIANDALIGQYMNTISKGNMGEFAVSMGMNFNNTLYFGVTLAALNIFHDREIMFEEHYSNNDAAEDRPLRNMRYYQRLRTYGDGFNFKVGAIVRPIPELRIGVAFHSPTWAHIETRYISDMTIVYDGYGTGYSTESTPRSYFNEKYRTPPRLLAGISYTIGNMAIISADYDCTWYNGIRLRGDLYSSSGIDEMTGFVKEYMAPANSFRVGAEVKPLPDLSLRAGYAYTGSGWNDDVNDGRIFFDTPVELDSNTYSAGLGFRFGRMASLDITYMYSKMNYSEYDLYFIDLTPRDRSGNPTVNYTRHAASGFIRPEYSRHSVMLSLGLRF